MEYVGNAFEDFVVSYYFLEPTAYYANGGARGLKQRIAVKSDIGPLCELPWRRMAERGGG